MAKRIIYTNINHKIKINAHYCEGILRTAVPQQCGIAWAFTTPSSVPSSTVQYFSQFFLVFIVVQLQRRLLLQRRPETATSMPYVSHSSEYLEIMRLYPDIHLVSGDRCILNVSVMVYYYYYSTRLVMLRLTLII